VASRQIVRLDALRPMLPLVRMRGWLGAALPRFLDILTAHTDQLRLIRARRPAEVLVRADEESGLFLALAGGAWVLPAKPSDGPSPAGWPLRPGYLCGEFESGLTGVNPFPFSSRLTSLTSDASVLHMKLSVARQIYDDASIRDAVLNALTKRTYFVLQRCSLREDARNVAQVSQLILQLHRPSPDRPEQVMSQHGIANVLDCDPRTVRRAVRSLHDQGLLKVTRAATKTMYQLPNLAKLRVLAQYGRERRQQQIRPANGYKRRDDPPLDV
jgi:hypothetical protein